MDERFTALFNEFLKLEYGVEGEDFSLSTVAETVSYYYLQLRHADGVDQIVYEKDEGKWQFIS